MDKVKICNYKDCQHVCVHDLYNFCACHIKKQKPLCDLEKPDTCPICFESTNTSVIQLTCGHYLHKECMIKCGRPTCPICKQFVYMTKDVFLRLRINNLRWKLNHIPHVIDTSILKLFTNLFNDFDDLIINNDTESMLNTMDKILQSFNKEILDLYYNS